MALDPKALSETATRYKSVTIDGLKIAYREAGPKDVPTILLLHGFPTSSHMFRDLIPLLSDCYHLIAPDYPGFGYSAAPRVGEFNYTFDALADLILAFTDALGLKRYMIYLQDKDVAFALHANYGSNVLLYPSWHEYFRQYHPRTLVVWGKGDHIFTVAGAEAYRKDLPKAEVYILDTGHFALETHAPRLAYRGFLCRNY